MNGAALDRAFRAASARIIAALAARYRDLDVAEEAFADACVKAAGAWSARLPDNPTGWLYRVADRAALDSLRRRRTRAGFTPEPPPSEPSVEDLLAGDARAIPDERLRLIFVCCHPAVAPEARAALTLRLVCGLSTLEIARAFLLSETAVAQRLVRAKRKIADAGVSFEIPPREFWPERLGAVLSTLEVAYAKAHEDAAGSGPHAGFAREMLSLTELLAELLPGHAEVLSFAALVRYAEARRPARLDDSGVMTPLSEQDPMLWDQALIRAGEHYLHRAAELRPSDAYTLEAAIHATWCGRTSLVQPPPWPAVLRLYDALATLSDDPITRLNRAVALSEVAGPQAGLAEVEALENGPLAVFAPFHAVRADLLRRVGRLAEATLAYAAALDLTSGSAERRWLERRVAALGR